MMGILMIGIVVAEVHISGVDSYINTTDINMNGSINFPNSYLSDEYYNSTQISFNGSTGEIASRNDCDIDSATGGACLGRLSVNKGDSALLIGVSNNITFGGAGSFCGGTGSTTTGLYSFAHGFQCSASNIGAFATGIGAQSTGVGSISMGFGTQATSSGAFLSV